MEKRIMIKCVNSIPTYYRWNSETLDWIIDNLDIIHSMRIENRPLFDEEPNIQPKNEDNHMDSEKEEVLRNEVLELSHLRTSPKEIARKLAADFTEDEVFSMVDRLSDENLVYFDVEEDILLYTGANK